MNQSLKKTCLLSLMVICGGFAILCFLEKESSWLFWVLGFCGALMVYLLLFHPKKDLQKPEEKMQSVLSPKAQEALALGQIPRKEDLASNFPLQAGEKLLWADQMRTDYYQSKPHLVYLTNQRIVCFEPDFSFSHPIGPLTIRFSPSKITLQKGKKNMMSFLVASPEAFEQAWKLAQS